MTDKPNWTDGLPTTDDGAAIAHHLLGFEAINNILEAVRQVLIVDEDEICDANLHLLETSIKYSLVSEDECNTG